MVFLPYTNLTSCIPGCSCPHLPGPTTMGVHYRKMSLGSAWAKHSMGSIWNGQGWRGGVSGEAGHRDVQAGIRAFHFGLEYWPLRSHPHLQAFRVCDMKEFYLQMHIRFQLVESLKSQSPLKTDPHGRSLALINQRHQNMAPTVGTGKELSPNFPPKCTSWSCWETSKVIL